MADQEPTQASEVPAEYADQVSGQAEVQQQHDQHADTEQDDQDAHAAAVFAAAAVAAAAQRHDEPQQPQQQQVEGEAAEQQQELQGHEQHAQHDAHEFDTAQHTHAAEEGQGYAEHETEQLSEAMAMPEHEGQAAAAVDGADGVDGTLQGAHEVGEEESMGEHQAHMEHDETQQGYSYMQYDEAAAYQDVGEGAAHDGEEQQHLQQQDQHLAHEEQRYAEVDMHHEPEGLEEQAGIVDAQQDEEMHHVEHGHHPPPPPPAAPAQGDDAGEVGKIPAGGDEQAYHHELTEEQAEAATHLINGDHGAEAAAAAASAAAEAMAGHSGDDVSSASTLIAIQAQRQHHAQEQGQGQDHDAGGEGDESNVAFAADETMGGGGEEDDEEVEAQGGSAGEGDAADGGRAHALRRPRPSSGGEEGDEGSGGGGGGGTESGGDGGGGGGSRPTKQARKFKYLEDAAQAEAEAAARAAAEGLAPKPKVPRKKTKKACLFCKRSHMPCEEARPCQRCIKRGIADMCRDADPGPSASSSPAKATPRRHANGPRARHANASGASAGSPASGSAQRSGGGVPAAAGSFLPTLSAAALSAARNNGIATGHEAPPPLQAATGSLRHARSGMDLGLEGGEAHADDHAQHAASASSLSSAEKSELLKLLQPGSEEESEPHDLFANHPLSLLADPVGLSSTTDAFDFNPFNELAEEAARQHDVATAAAAASGAAGAEHLADASMATGGVTTDGGKAGGGLAPGLGRVPLAELPGKHPSSPYSYTCGYARLAKWTHARWTPQGCHTLDAVMLGARQRALACTREAGSATSGCADAGAEAELQFADAVARYEAEVLPAVPTPLLVARRTFEVFGANEHLARLTHLPRHAFEGGRLALYHLLDEESMCRVAQLYADAVTGGLPEPPTAMVQLAIDRSLVLRRATAAGETQPSPPAARVEAQTDSIVGDDAAAVTLGFEGEGSGATHGQAQQEQQEPPPTHEEMAAEAEAAGHGDETHSTAPAATSSAADECGGGANAIAFDGVGQEQEQQEARDAPPPQHVEMQAPIVTDSAAAALDEAQAGAALEADAVAAVGAANGGVGDDNGADESAAAQALPGSEPGAGEGQGAEGEDAAGLVQGADDGRGGHVEGDDAGHPSHANHDDDVGADRGDRGEKGGTEQQEVDGEAAAAAAAAAAERGTMDEDQGATAATTLVDDGAPTLISVRCALTLEVKSNDAGVPVVLVASLVPVVV